jgi:hypothetical protein
MHVVARQPDFILDEKMSHYAGYKNRMFYRLIEIPQMTLSGLFYWGLPNTETSQRLIKKYVMEYRI